MPGLKTQWASFDADWDAVRDVCVVDPECCQSYDTAGFCQGIPAVVPQFLYNTVAGIPASCSTNTTNQFGSLRNRTYRVKRVQPFPGFLAEWDNLTTIFAAVDCGSSGPAILVKIGVFDGQASFGNLTYDLYTNVTTRLECGYGPGYVNFTTTFTTVYIGTNNPAFSPCYLQTVTALTGLKGWPPNSNQDNDTQVGWFPVPSSPPYDMDSTIPFGDGAQIPANQTICTPYGTPIHFHLSD